MPAPGSQPPSRSIVEAVFRGSLEQVSSLLVSGIDVNWRCPDDCPLLHYAVMSGRAETVKLLLQAGADVNARTRDGVTPLISAIEWGYDDVVEALLAFEADATAQDQYGRTALKLARDNGHDRIVALLRGAATVRLDLSDLTPSRTKEKRPEGATADTGCDW